MALMQLVAYGTPGIWLVGNGSGTPANIHDSLQYYFVDRENGLPELKDVYEIELEKTHPILVWSACPLDKYEGERPTWDLLRTHDYSNLYRIKHSPEVRTFPYNVTKERSARKIQAAWREAIANPRLRLCRKRLLREFHGLMDE